MSAIRRTLRRSTLPVLLVLCLAALSVSYAFADEAQRPFATQVIGDPDAAVIGKLAVGTATPGNKALTVVGVIDFLGAGTVHNYFTQGTGNNMQINTNVDEANAVGNATKSQWKLVLGSSLDWFSIRRSPAGGTYNEDALFFIQGSTGNVGIATVDTNNNASIPFVPMARLDVETASGDAVWGITTDTTGMTRGVYGQSDSTVGAGVYGDATATTGVTYGVFGESDSSTGYGVQGWATAADGNNTGIYGQSDSQSGRGVWGWTTATAGTTYGVYGESDSPNGYGAFGFAPATSGPAYGVAGVSNSTSGSGVYGRALPSTGSTNGVYGDSYSTDGRGVYGYAWNTSGANSGVYGRSDSTSGRGVYGYAYAGSGSTYGVYGQSDSSVWGIGVLGWATSTTGYGGGVFGRSDAPDGYGVLGYASATSGSAKAVLGQSNSTAGYGVDGYAYATTGVNYGVYGRSNSAAGYGVYSYGNFAATGTKTAIVDTQDYGWRNLYAMESPQNWFEDFGQATLTAGEVVVPIEEVFAETVNLEKPYHVFLTPLGEGCTLFVEDKSSTSFTVRANEGSGCEIAFDYRIIAPRLDYEDLRLREAEDPQAMAASIPEVR
jgi:hypothetical protein